MGADEATAEIAVIPVPTRFDQDALLQVVANVAAGQTVRQACLPDNLPPYEWFAKKMLVSPHLHDMVLKAMEVNSLANLSDVQAMAANLHDQTPPPVKRLAIDTAVSMSKTLATIEKRVQQAQTSTDHSPNNILNLNIGLGDRDSVLPAITSTTDQPNPNETVIDVNTDPPKGSIAPPQAFEFKP